MSLLHICNVTEISLKELFTDFSWSPPTGLITPELRHDAGCRLAEGAKTLDTPTIIFNIDKASGRPY